jgi:hypothetical protein
MFTSAASLLTADAHPGTLWVSYEVKLQQEMRHCNSAEDTILTEYSIKKGTPCPQDIFQGGVARKLLTNLRLNRRVYLSSGI